MIKHEISFKFICSFRLPWTRTLSVGLTHCWHLLLALVNYFLGIASSSVSMYHTRRYGAVSGVLYTQILHKLCPQRVHHKSLPVITLQQLQVNTTLSFMCLLCKKLSLYFIWCKQKSFYLFFYSELYFTRMCLQWMKYIHVKKHGYCGYYCSVITSALLWMKFR